MCLSLQETFGAMAKTEKIAYILEQVRGHQQQDATTSNAAQCWVQHSQADAQCPLGFCAAGRAEINVAISVLSELRQQRLFLCFACSQLQQHTAQPRPREHVLRLACCIAFSLLWATLPPYLLTCRVCLCVSLLLCLTVQVRLCLAKKDYIRAQILARKISPRAFQKQQGDSKGEIGIEGTAIEEADVVSGAGCCFTAADVRLIVVMVCFVLPWRHELWLYCSCLGAKAQC
jgi:hypothetical protein